MPADRRSSVRVPDYTLHAVAALVMGAHVELDFGAWLSRVLAEVDDSLEGVLSLSERAADPIHREILASLVSSGLQWAVGRPGHELADGHSDQLELPAR